MHNDKTAVADSVGAEGSALPVKSCNIFWPRAVTNVIRGRRC